jgi:REP element-mobilizing transposase RayT
MDRHWFLTSTCYGNWLPGDPRGFVGNVYEHRSFDPTRRRRVTHNVPETEYDRRMPGLYLASESRLKGEPIRLAVPHAEALLAQFQETAQHRKWELLAVAIMYNHFHIVVGVVGDPNPAKILGDFKSWATRRLNEQFGKPESESWWTYDGSKRKLSDDKAILAASHYVLYRQPNPLITWSPRTGLCYGIPPRDFEVLFHP